MAIKLYLSQANQAAFSDKVSIGPDCWEWTGALDHAGYGVMHQPGTKGSVWKAHRYAYVLFRGPLPCNLFVCHTCDNPACVKPSHLFLGTHEDNMADMRRKGRSNAGQRNGRSKLTAGDVLDIRARCAMGELHREIADSYGVCRQTVDFVASGKTWRCVA